MGKSTAKVIKAIEYLSLPFEWPDRFFKLARLVLSQRELTGELVRMAPFRTWYERNDFKTVIDVGAYIGAFALAVRTLLPQAHIYSFEPQPVIYQRLVKNIGQDEHFRAFQTALGEQQGEISFWQSSFAASSSALPMSDLHKQAFPYTAQNTPLRVPVGRLDDFLPQMNLQAPVLLKVDVQGYEDRVLRGAKETLRQVDYLITEVSYRQLYEGQVLFAELNDLLAAEGFVFRGTFDSLVSPLDGSLVQQDALFVRILE